MDNDALSADETKRVRALYTNSMALNLRVAADWSIARYYRALRAAGHSQVKRRHEAIFLHTGLDGARVVDVAAANAVTKNAIGQLANELEAAGYIRRAGHPSDGRAKLLRYTPRGLELIRDQVRAGEFLEQETARLIGREKSDQLRSLLEDLAREIRRETEACMAQATGAAPSQPDVAASQEDLASSPEDVAGSSPAVP